MRKIATVLLLLTISSTGCSVMSPQPTREINFSVLKLGTPAIVVNEAGRSSIVNVLVPAQNGEMIPGKVDATGFMLLDKPTFDVYREAWQKSQPKPPEAKDEEPEVERVPPPKPASTVKM